MNLKFGVAHICAKYGKSIGTKAFRLSFDTCEGGIWGCSVADFGVTCLGETLQMVDNKSFSVKTFQRYSCYSSFFARYDIFLEYSL
jgi:hypothetical protein